MLPKYPLGGYLKNLECRNYNVKRIKDDKSIYLKDGNFIMKTSQCRFRGNWKTWRGQVRYCLQLCHIPMETVPFCGSRDSPRMGQMCTLPRLLFSSQTANLTYS